MARRPPSSQRTSPRPSEALRRKLELVLPALVGSSWRLVTDSRIRDLYPEYLVAMHGVVRASVPLMEAALRRAEELADVDPAAEALAPYLAAHADEERDHDEWLLCDLEAIGEEPSSVLLRPPSPTVAALVGAQYYWIRHYHPVALLGYVSVLEGYPPSAELANELIARTGYPREAFRTMLAHAELDPGHREDLDAALDELPLTREQTAVMGLSGLHTIALLTQLLDEVVAGGAR